jgi:peroxiredoxin Q/BCP
MAYGIVKNDKGNAARVTFYIGKDGKILYVDDQVSAKSAGEGIAAKLKELGVDKS